MTSVDGKIPIVGGDYSNSRSSGRRAGRAANERMRTAAWSRGTRPSRLLLFLRFLHPLAFPRKIPAAGTDVFQWRRFDPFTRLPVGHRWRCWQLVAAPLHFSQLNSAEKKRIDGRWGDDGGCGGRRARNADGSSWFGCDGRADGGNLLSLDRNADGGAGRGCGLCNDGGRRGLSRLASRDRVFPGLDETDLLLS